MLGRKLRSWKSGSIVLNFANLLHPISRLTFKLFDDGDVRQSRHEGSESKGESSLLRKKSRSKGDAKS